MTKKTYIKCIACGAPLIEYKKVSALRCEYCGSEYIPVHKDGDVELQIVSLSSPAMENLKNELKLLDQEQDHTLTKEKSHLGFITVRNTGIGLLGGCATFLVSFIAVFICSADIAGLLKSTTNINLVGDQVVPYLLLCSTIMTLVFLVWFAIFASRKQKQLSQEGSSKQRDVEKANAE
jgi:DNA-directed RNA polymerase subunit RPC12/RpoP